MSVSYTHLATKAHFFEKTYFFYKLKLDQIGDNNDDRNQLDEIALKEAIIGLDYREKNILKPVSYTHLPH